MSWVLAVVLSCLLSLSEQIRFLFSLSPPSKSGWRLKDSGRHGVIDFRVFHRVKTDAEVLLAWLTWSGSQSSFVSV